MGEPWAPVLILGCYRSGTSAVAALLSEAAGLQLGQIMPPLPSYPLGTFESVEVVRAHNDLLNRLDRDWTCPPPELELGGMAAGPLRETVARWEAEGHQWGVKDPRLLFMLPLWASMLPRVRLVGVVREHEEVVRSLVEVEGMEPGAADALVRAYVSRLRCLAERFSFPVIDFSSPRDEFLSHVAGVAISLGLTWSAERAETIFDEALPGSRSRAQVYDASATALRTRPRVLVSETVTRGELSRAIAALPRPDIPLDRFGGPRQALRREAAWSKLGQVRGTVLEISRNLRGSATFNPVPPHGHAVECRDLDRVANTLRVLEDQPEGIVLPDAISWVSRGDLERLFTVLYRSVVPNGSVALVVSRADGELRRGQGLDPVTENDILGFAESVGFVSLGFSGDSLLRVLHLVAPKPRETALSEALGESQHREEELRRELQQLGDQVDRMAARERAQAAQAQENIDRLRLDLSAARAQAVCERDARQHLAGRRSVRAALALAKPAKPLIRLVRQVRPR